jgi:hypothetical protein
MGYHVQELLYPVEREHCLFIDRDIQAAWLPAPLGPNRTPCTHRTVGPARRVVALVWECVLGIHFMRGTQSLSGADDV